MPAALPLAFGGVIVPRCCDNRSLMSRLGGAIFSGGGAAALGGATCTVGFDGDAGCDPADSSTGHSQGLAALAFLAAGGSKLAGIDVPESARLRARGRSREDRGLRRPRH